MANIKISELPLGTPSSTSIFPFVDNGTTYKGAVSAITSNGNSVIETTYSTLQDMVNGGGLSTGSYYIITDFRTCYDQPNFDYNNNPIIDETTYQISDVHPIIVFATSENTLAVDAYQPDYPNDRIKYDVYFSETEVTNQPAYGRITERIDEYNNRTDYDHRNIKFKRYKTYFPNDELSGRILSMNDGEVIGDSTYFTEDFNVGSIVYIIGPDPQYYEVIEIISNTEMIVGGFSYYNFGPGYGVPYWSTTVESLFEPGSLYYFNDVGTNAIEDGGNDMYDGGNNLNTNLSSNIPYTHTQMTDPPVNAYEQASYLDFTYDGTVQNGDSYFNTGSNYFTNLYPGLFVMVAYGINIDEFFVHDNLGADGGGNFNSNLYTYNGYSIYTKSVYAAQDPSVTHLFIVNTIDGNIVHTPGDTGDNTDDVLSNITGATQIHYLLFALGGGIEPTEQQIQGVYQSYIDLIDSGDINNTLSILNSSFTGVTSNLPANNQVYISHNYKQTNITGDTNEYRQLYTFPLGVNFVANNYIGDHSNVAQFNEETFILSNNVFFGGDCVSTKLGESCYNNTIGNGSYNNQIGVLFYNNVIYNDFYDNFIGNSFSYNTIISNFSNNKINNNFSGNYIIKNGFNYNSILNDFTYNKLSSNYFDRNEIGNSFYSNFIYSNFTDNVVGNNFNNNTIDGNTENNVIENVFQYNTIKDYFGENQIGNEFKGNVFYNEFFINEVDSYIGGNNFSGYTAGNKIGAFTFDNDFLGSCTVNSLDGDFYGNTIDYEFTRNKFGSEIYGNTIGNNFQTNQIGNYFHNNTIGDNFGYGFSDPQGNKIGNNFYGNTIGEYFYNNIIPDNFHDNTVFNYFQWNDIRTSVIGTTLTPCVFYSSTTVNVFKNNGGDIRLSYYDSSDILTVENFDENTCLSFTITSSRISSSAAFGGIFSNVTNDGYTLDNNENNALWGTYYINITGDDSDITAIFNSVSMLTNGVGYVWYVSWGSGSTESTLAKVGYDSGTKRMYIITIDSTDPAWQTNGSVVGTALVGTFNFPATFTVYFPITDKSGWC